MEYFMPIMSLCILTLLNGYCTYKPNSLIQYQIHLEVTTINPTSKWDQGRIWDSNYEYKKNYYLPTLKVDC